MSQLLNLWLTKNTNDKTNSVINSLAENKVELMNSFVALWGI